MEALDGNAIAGELADLFGYEMTTARGACAHCRSSSLIAELRIYSRAPGIVARCPHCGDVVLVITEIRGETRADLSGFPLADPPA